MELYKNAFKFNEELDYLIWEIGELVIKELQWTVVINSNKAMFCERSWSGFDTVIPES